MEFSSEVLNEAYRKQNRTAAHATPCLTTLFNSMFNSMFNYTD